MVFQALFSDSTWLWSQCLAFSVGLWALYCLYYCLRRREENTKDCLQDSRDDVEVGTKDTTAFSEVFGNQQGDNEKSDALDEKQQRAEKIVLQREKIRARKIRAREALAMRKREQRAEKIRPELENGKPLGVPPLQKGGPSMRVASCEYYKCRNKARQGCSGCRKIFYCSVKCQVDDWKRHAKECSWRSTLTRR